MSQEPTTPDPVELTRSAIEAADRGDFDAMLSFFAPDAVWDMLPLGMGAFEGHVAIRGFWKDWYSSYEEFGVEAEAVVDLCNGVTFGVLVQKGRPIGTSGEVQLRYASVSELVDGLFVRITNYTDINEARAAAERLAEERE